MFARIKRHNRGFTLVELMIVVAIIGVLAALAVYGVNRYVTSAKSAEAKEMLGRIAKDAVVAFDREVMVSTLLSDGASVAGGHQLCASATAVPEAPTAGKYQSTAAEWSTGSATEGWQCLKFSVTGPQYFSYDYNATGNTAFEAIALGELGGSTDTHSTFRIEGAVRAGMATFSPTIQETNPEE